jgi:indolepyruvate ferredoxin oxidoreductase alpha subunit
MHSGITSLVDIVYNKGISTVLILDNSITGMTGHQQNPTTGLTLRNEPTTAIDLQKLCEGLGIRRIRVADPGDLSGLESAIREELGTDEPSVVIVRRPCALLPQAKAAQLPPLQVDAEKCASCRMCMKLGCPAVSFDGKAAIDPTQCVGCELCVQMCKFGAIGKEAH